MLREIFARADLIVKVKEPLAEERRQLRRGQTIFTYLNLAPDLEQTRDLLTSGVTAIAYETVQTLKAICPCYSRCRKSPAVWLRRSARIFSNGRGVGVASCSRARRAPLPRMSQIIGAGHAGSNAAMIALGMGADVVALARSPQSLQQASALCGPRLRSEISTPESIATACRNADLVICAALAPGATAAKLVSAATIKTMKQGSVIVDISSIRAGTWRPHARQRIRSRFSSWTA